MTARVCRFCYGGGVVAEGRETLPLNALDTAHVILEAQSNA